MSVAWTNEQQANFQWRKGVWEGAAAVKSLMFIVVLSDMMDNVEVNKLEQLKS